MHVDGAALTLETGIPHALHDHISGNHNAVVLHQQLEQFKLLIGQLDGLSVHIDHALFAVEGHIAAGHQAFLRPAGTAQKRLYPRDHLHHAERFGDIVVRAAVKPFHLIDFGGFRRHQNDGNLLRVRARAQPLEDGKSVLIRQHDIQQNQFRQFFGKRAVKLLRRLKSDGLIAAVFERKNLDFLNVAVILDNVNHAFYSPALAVCTLATSGRRYCFS